MTTADIFVPGRLCLAGEHSDWAATYITRSPHITTGAALVVGLQQGLYAEVKSSPILILSSPLASTLQISCDQLLYHARSNSPWRYAAAVAHLMHERFQLNTAVSIRITRETLPPGKGFSSSASVCVLVARAYNLVHALSLTEAGEMDFAYQSECLTGSKCGRMDQIVAIGPGRVAHMTFDGLYASHRVLKTPKHPIYIVVASIGTKDTRTILEGLQGAFPNADTPRKIQLQRCLGVKNLQLVDEMEKAMCDGDSKTLGRLMTLAQENFDNAAISFCPEQLTSPALHGLLRQKDLLVHAYGGKGVGSQGDGAVQFVAKSKADSQALCDLLCRSLGKEGFVVTIGDMAPMFKCDPAPLIASARRIPGDGTLRTAVIPAAGFGTRLFPASRSIRPKALFPIVDTDGFAKPLLLHQVEQCVDAGISTLVIVVAPGEQEKRVREVFSPIPHNWHVALKPHMRAYAERIEKLGEVVHIANQSEPKGFGHAVASANVSEEEPFLLLLGDVMFHAAATSNSCVRQVVDAFKTDPSRSVVAVTNVPISESSSYGVVQTSTAMDTSYKRVPIRNIIEKPSKEQAKSLSHNGKCSIVLGPYAFTPALIRELGEDILSEKMVKGEVQLTPAMISVLEKEGMDAVLLDGQALDIGNASDYQRTMTFMGRNVQLGQKNR